MLTRKLSPQTINRRLAVVRRILNIAYREWEWITEPIGQKIKLLSERGMAREFFLTKAEVEALLSEITDEEAYKVIYLSAYTGLRRGEILKLRKNQWKTPYITLDNKTKSGRPRTVPVIEELQPLVTLPFNLTEHQLRVAFEKARTAIGKPHIRFHDLRHTFASWLAENPDIPFTVIRDLLGHSNLTVTSKYTHLRGTTYKMINAALKK